MAFLLGAAGSAPALTAQSHLYNWKADYAGQWFGSVVASAGDVNADGYDDVITATGWDTRVAKSGVGARVYSGRDGSLLLTVQVPAYPSLAVAGAGDLDRDGHADVVIWAWNSKAWGPELWFVSGKSGHRIRTILFKGLIGLDRLARAGDVNKDGYPDLLVGLPTYGTLSTHGRVFVISGKDGSTIHDLKPTNINYRWFGWSLADAGDVDGDGYADFLVGDPRWGSYLTFVGPGRVWLYSGKTGKVLRTFAEPLTARNSGLGLGDAVASAGDVDGDGVLDLAMGAPGYDTNAVDAGAVFIHSGKTGARIRSAFGSKASSYLGGSLYGHGLVSVGDWNRDGIPDLAVGAMGSSVVAPSAGSVFVYSGKDFKILASLHGSKKSQGYGVSVASGLDMDGDGRTDLLVGTEEGSLSRNLVPEFQAWSPVKKTLWSDTHKVSLAKQSKQILQLDAGAKHAGSTYFLLGSMSGIRPGLKLGALTLPLQVDPYFWLTATVPNAPFLKGSLGVLDSKGQARATFTAVTGMPQGLIGGRADHAYVVFGKTGFTLTSNWVPLLFEK